MKFKLTPAQYAAAYQGAMDELADEMRRYGEVDVSGPYAASIEARDMLAAARCLKECPASAHRAATRLPGPLAEEQMVTISWTDHKGRYIALRIQARWLYAVMSSSRPNKDAAPGLRFRGPAEEVMPRYFYLTSEPHVQTMLDYINTKLTQ